MVINMRFSIDAELREAIRLRAGRKGKAARAEVRSEIDVAVSGYFEDIMFEAQNVREGRGGNQARSPESEGEE